VTAIVESFRADGSVMNLADLQVEDIDFARMASGLSKLARFNGTYDCPAYMVAQHSVVGADALHRETGNQIVAGYFLLHDGHEYLIGDQTRPALGLLGLFVERAGGKATVLKKASAAMKQALDAVIHRAAKLPPLVEFPDYARLVAAMDERMLRAEALALFGPRAADHLPPATHPAPKLTGSLRPWGAAKAEEAFVDRLDRYLGIHLRAAP